MKKMRLSLALISLTLVATFAAYAQSPAPIISAATPSAIDAGTPSVTITLTMNTFVPGAVVRWSGTPLVTEYVNDTTLRATVPGGLLALCGKFFLTVGSAQNGPVLSNSFPIIVNPVLTSISPNLLPAGTGGVTVNATGVGFSSNVHMTMLASGTRTDLPTGISQSTTALSASIPASALNGTYPSVSLYVADPTTGAVSQSLPITLTFAQVTAIQPNRIVAGIAFCNLESPACFTLGVFGANFVGGAQVLFEGAPLATSYIGSNLLAATVPAALVHDAVPGGVGIQVKNPGTTATNTIKLVIDPNPFGSTILTLSPASGLAGSPAITLTVNGEGFGPTSTVVWVRTPLQTTYVSSTQLTAIIPQDLLALEGSAPISISTPGSPTSNTVNFPIVAALPTISNAADAVTPHIAVAGGPGFTMTVNGAGFIPASQVTGLTGATTTYVSQNQLKANVPASAITTPGQYAIRVQNPGPILSPQAPLFTVTASAPSIKSLTPASVLTGGPAFTLTVTGANFVPNGVVMWNGAALATTFASTSQMNAQVPANLIAAAGIAKITVVSAGTQVSNELPLPVSASLTPVLSNLSPSSVAPGGPDFVLTLTGAGFTVNTTVQWNITTLSSTFVTSSQLTARVPAALIAASGTVTIGLTGENGVSNTLPFTILPGTPTVNPGGILNAASSKPVIAPGTLIAIYGSNLATATIEAGVTPLPIILGGTKLSINGTDAPLLFVSPGQVNAQVPYEIKVGTAKLILTANGVPSAPVNFDVAATGPGVFTPQESTHVLALNLADGTLNSPQTPARPGQYVTAYLTGQGVVNPAATTGDVAPSAPPFPVPVAPVLVKIGGVTATLQFAGLAPGFIGLMQLNILIPDVPAGELPLDVTIGTIPAAPTTISIAK